MSLGTRSKPRSRRSATPAPRDSSGEDYPSDSSSAAGTANRITEFWNMDDFGKAEEMYQKALEGYEAQLGKEHIDTTRCAENYRDYLEESGNKEGMAHLKKGHPNVESYDT